MATKFRKGDRVKTPKGNGIVQHVRTWRDAIISMSNEQAVTFSRKCGAKYGLGFKEDWFEVLVFVADVYEWFEGDKVSHIEAGG